MDRITGTGMGGRSSVAFEPTGVVWSIDVPGDGARRWVEPFSSTLGWLRSAGRRRRRRGSPPAAAPDDHEEQRVVEESEAAGRGKGRPKLS